MTSDEADVKELSQAEETKVLPQIAELKNEETFDEDSSNDTDAPATKKRKKGGSQGKRPLAEVLQRRREGRIKAQATIANNLKKTGIGRFEEENGFSLTSVKQIPLVNQKNYYTDYLKKDEQVSFIRNWRTEKLLTQKIKNLKKDETKKDDSGNSSGGDSKTVANFNLTDIEAEMNLKKSSVGVGGEEEEEEEEEEEADNDAEEISEEKAKLGFDTIVIQPGSANIRIGRATDAFPKTVPSVIAIPNTDEDSVAVPLAPERTVDEEGEVTFNQAFDVAKEEVTKDFKARMRYYKRRVLPNSRETAANYNRRQEPESIPDHNDPMKKDWLDINDEQFRSKKYFVGEDALNLPICAKFNEWKLRYPLVNGRFNENSTDYSSPQEVLGDLSNILVEALNDMEIKKSQLVNLKAILVIPDLYDKMFVETWCSLLLRQVGFGKVSIIQEAVLATFGAGASSACVVDVGAHTTTIACVEEGMVINDSRIVLNYGGDHITEAFIKLLLQSQFPYKNVNLNSKNDDWELAQRLKQSFVTFQDADIAVQLYNFYKRKPFETTEKYEFKVFDEVMLAPLGLYYPDLFQIQELCKVDRRLFTPSKDQYSCLPNNPYSRSQENVVNKQVNCDLTDGELLLKILDERANLKSSNPYAKPKPAKTLEVDNCFINCTVPLEKALIESITNAGIATDFNKAKKFYDNILVVGGGLAKIPGYDLVLTDRINIWRHKFLSTTTLDEILDYVHQERLKVEAEKQELINECKIKKQKEDQPLDEIELTESEMAHIDNKTQLHLDWDYLDSICDKGGLLPVTVLPPPREFDPEMLTWKGGSVYGRLKVVGEMWVTQADWDLLESRCLYYKSLFNY